MSGSQSSLSAGDEKFIPESDKAISPAAVAIDDKARRSAKWKMDFYITGFSTLIYLMSYVEASRHLSRSSQYGTDSRFLLGPRIFCYSCQTYLSSSVAS